jgi:hypothetical protein
MAANMVSTTTAAKKAIPGPASNLATAPSLTKATEIVMT